MGVQALKSHPSGKTHKVSSFFRKGFKSKELAENKLVETNES